MRMSFESIQIAIPGNTDIIQLPTMPETQDQMLRFPALRYVQEAKVELRNR